MNTQIAGHETSIRVRYAETDRMGIAYNSHYLVWFEVGRTEFLRSLGFAYREMERRDVLLPVIEAGVKFLKPALYDEVLTISAFFGRKPGARLHILYEVIRGNEAIASGYTEHAFTNAALEPVKPPRELLASLRAAWERTSALHRSEE